MVIDNEWSVDTGSSMVIEIEIWNYTRGTKKCAAVVRSEF